MLHLSEASALRTGEQPNRLLRNHSGVYTLRKDVCSSKKDGARDPLFRAPHREPGDQFRGDLVGSAFLLAGSGERNGLCADRILDR